MTRSIRKLLTLTLSLLAFSHAVQAAVTHTLGSVPRNVQFSGLSTEDGLSSEFVHDLVQDRRGYLWFATQTGLNRFDGHEVTVYEHRSEDRGTISHSFVWSLLVDDAGVLWVGTDRGVNTYDPATNRFDRTPLGEALAFVRVRAIAQDGAGRLWIGSIGSGLFSADPRTGEVVNYRHDPEDPASLPSDHVMDILSDRAGVLWVATNGGGLARLDDIAGAFRVFRHEADDPASLSDDDLRTVYEDGAGRLWIGTTQGGLNRLDRTTGRFTRYAHDPDNTASLGSGQVLAVFEDARKTLWVGTEGGLSEWRPSAEGFVTYRRDVADDKSLINDRINAITQDASGVLWLATSGGVNSWNYVSDTFQQFGTARGYLDSDVVSSLAESSDGAIWIGTYGGGLSRLDLATGTTRHFRHDANDANSLGDDRVMAVYVDSNDTVWVGTRSAGLDRMNDDGTFTHFRHDASDPATLSGNAVPRIFSDSSGTLWVGVFGGGLNRIRFEADRAVIDRFRHDPEDESSLSGDRVLAIHEDRDGVLWVGTENAGLNRFVPESGHFERIDVEDVQASDGSNPVSGTPWEFYEAPDGTTWIGTLGQGLLRWSADDKAAGIARFDRFRSADGLASEIYGIVGGQAGALWLSSSRGLFRFDPRSGNVRRFDRSNGLRNNEFNVGARLRTRSGLLLFGGTAGLVGFDPHDLPHNWRPPPIDLTAKSRTAVMARTQPGTTSSIELGYRDPFVSFEFVALDFMSPDKNAYRFRLAGYDNDWNDADGYRRAIYSSLPAGKYTFEVQASNSDGVWNRDSATMQLTVVPPPWRTWWAYVAYAASVACLIAWLLWRHAHKRRREFELRMQLERLVSERTTELADRNQELELLNQRFQEASVTDQLTGLRNRRYVNQYIEEEVSTVQRRHVESAQPMPDGTQRDSSKLLFVVMIDLDGFKPINDTFGHHTGDVALVEIKNRLVACCRTSDVVVRWGGDEFLIVGHTASFDGAKVVAEKVRRTLAEEPYDLGPGRSGRLSASMGLATIPFVDGQPGFGSWEQIVAIADHGAYLAKSNGRNAWVSIRGTSTMSFADFDGVKENMETLVEQGKLVVDSSVPGGIHLHTDAVVARTSAG